MKFLNMAVDHAINITIIFLNYIMLDDIGAVIAILVGLTWIIKNVIDIRWRIRRRKNDETDRERKSD